MTIIIDDGQKSTVWLGQNMARQGVLFSPGAIQFVMKPDPMLAADTDYIASVLTKILWTMGHLASPTRFLEDLLEPTRSDTSWRCLLCDLPLEAHFATLVTSIHPVDDKGRFGYSPTECTQSNQADVELHCPACNLSWEAEIVWDSALNPRIAVHNAYRPFYRLEVELGITRRVFIDYSQYPSDGNTSWPKRLIGCRVCHSHQQATGKDFLGNPCPCCEGKGLVTVAHYRTFQQKLHQKEVQSAPVDR